MDDTTRLLTSPHSADPGESGLRPQRLGDYVGQPGIRRNLEVFIQAALKRGQALDHALLSGPPGLGKTTLAHILATEMHTALRTTSGPVLERQGDLVAILTNLAPGEVLFIDEIHRMPRVVEEVLYPAMEDFKLDIIIGQGPMARTVKIDLPRFTLVGATTRTGLLSSPLRDRFGIQFRLQYYSPEELRTILGRSAAVLDVALEPEAALELARRSRGTPRVANRLLRRIRDFAEHAGAPAVSGRLVRESLAQLGIDASGLDPFHLEILQTIAGKFAGGPVGLSTLTAALSEPRDTIEEVYEPYLIQEGFLHKTPRGRMATAKAFTHLGLSGRREHQLSLPVAPEG